MNAKSNITTYVKDDRSNYRRWEMRDNAAVRALSADDRTLIAAAITRHNARVQRGNWRPVSKRSDYVAVLTAAVQQEVSPLVEQLYRTKVSGSTRIVIQIGAPYAAGDTSNNWNVYSKSARYPGKDATITINVMHGWRRHVANVPGLATAGGMLTTHAEPAPGEPDVWAATWVVQGRGVDLNAISGYIARDGAEWAHAATAAAALRLLATRRNQTARAARAKALDAKLRNLDRAALLATYGQITVAANDSKQAGNCPSGTRNFSEQYFPGRTTATVAELFATGAMENYVRRAVVAAILRQSK